MFYSKPATLPGADIHFKLSNPIKSDHMTESTNIYLQILTP